MAAVALAVGQAVSSGAPVGDGGTAATIGINQDNQSNSASFPVIMKQVAPKDKKHAGGDAQAVIPQVVDGIIAYPPHSDGTLPPPGIMLPFTASQALPSGSAQMDKNPTNGQGAGGVGGDGAGADGAAMPQAVAGGNPAIPARDRLIAASLPPATAGTEKSDKSAVSSDIPTKTMIPDMPSKTMTSNISSHKAAVELSSTAAIPGFSSSVAQFASAANYGAHTAKNGVPSPIRGTDNGLTGQSGSAVAPVNGADPASTANAGYGIAASLPGGDKVAVPAASASIAVPLQHPDWGNELGNRVTWMVQHDVHSASVKINPPNLGPIEMKISMVNDQVNVSFVSHHAPVREALDASIPRLREILGNNGLQLGDANVNHRSTSGQDHPGQQSFSPAHGGMTAYDNDAVGENGIESIPGSHYGMDSSAIDFYA